MKDIHGKIFFLEKCEHFVKTRWRFLFGNKKYPTINFTCVNEALALVKVSLLLIIVAIGAFLAGVLKFTTQCRKKSCY